MRGLRLEPRLVPVSSGGPGTPRPSGFPPRAAGTRLPARARLPERGIVLGILVLAAVPAPPLRAQSSLLLRETRRMLPAIPATPPNFETSTTDWTIADLDGDQDLDVWRSGEVLHDILINDGNGILSWIAVKPPALPPGSSETTVAAGDVDGDLDPDLLLGATNQGFGVPDLLYRNDGGATFTDVSGQLPGVATFTGAVALADVDGDGDLDAYGGTLNLAQPDRLFVNDGTGVFADTSGQLPSSGDTGRAIAFADVDGDGDLDAFAGHRLWRNDGTGTFTDDTAAAMPGYPSSLGATVAAGDVDGDLDPDVVLGGAGTAGGNLRVARNDGTGTFTDASGSLPALATAVGALLLADLDGDADRDVLATVGVPDTGLDLLLENDGTGTFQDVSSQLPSLVDSTVALAAGDLDGDQDLDLMLGNWIDATSGLTAASSPDRYYLNDGQGGFMDVSSQVPGYPSGMEDFLLADLDGDQDPDGIAALGVSPGIAVMTNAGNGVMVKAPAALSGAPAATRALAFVDLDGDGGHDVFAATGTTVSAADALFHDDGGATFTDVSSGLPALATDARALTAGDVDGDGEDDVLVAEGGLGAPAADTLYRGLGGGLFQDGSSSLPAVSDQSFDVLLADLDGDGDLDAILAGDPSDAYYRNDGAGNFTDDSGNLPQGTGISRAVAAGDVDGDLDLDVVMEDDDTGTGPTQNHLYLNQGDGTFTDASSRLPAQFSTSYVPTDVTLADLDGEGSLDVFVTRENFTDGLFLNDGLGFFSNDSSRVTQIWDYSSVAVAGDLDGDLDTDLLLPNRFSHRFEVLSGVTRDLSWRGLPRVGKSLTLDLMGPPLGFAVPVLSVLRTYVPLAYGVLQVGPGPVLPAIPLDGAGAGVLPLALPANPLLVGIPLYVQAFLGFPLALTDAEILTATAY